jgi:chitodextrinase
MRHTYRRIVTAAAVTAVACTSLTLPTAAAAQESTDPRLRVVDAWDVTSEATFPDGEVLPAFRPALTEAPNGDLLVGFNTTTDAHPGGQLRLIRSTDDGRTWGPSEVLAEPTLFGENGSIHVQRGMTTLDDGTILLPYNDGVNHVPYNNRESKLFVARSVDNGHTWSGTDRPVDLPVKFREAWGGGGRIVELADGTLLQTIWGIRELPEDWQTDPQHYESGVLRSFDGGRTWPEYVQIAHDPHSPPHFFGPGQLFPGGANESTLEVLPDGTIVAFVRFDIGVGPDAERSRFYISTSHDGGRSWSAPVGSALRGQTLSATTAPCTDYYDNNRAKLILGYRSTANKAAVSVSFDGGVSFQGETVLQDPRGQASFASAEPDYHRLDDGRLLTVFQIQSGGGPFRLAANILEDGTDAATCRAQLAAADASAAASPTFVVERADRDAWFLPMSNVRVTHPATQTVAEVINAHASRLVCNTADALKLRTRNGRVLNPAKTLAEAGVVNGDILQLDGGAHRGRLARVGWTELDAYPADRAIANWDRACASGAIALDYRSRSLGLDLALPVGRDLQAVELRDSDAVSRLTSADYRLFTSEDNNTYTELNGWSFSSRMDNGRLVHRFDGLNTTARYLKIAQSKSDSAFTFILLNTRDDVTIEYI